MIINTIFFSMSPDTIWEIYTPQNKHGSPENGGPLEREIPALETIISRFQPLIFGKFISCFFFAINAADPGGMSSP